MKLIAELCQNHNGNIEALVNMIDDAAEAGATHVKIQHIFAENVTFRPQFEHGGVDNVSGVEFIKRPYDAEYKRMKGLELDDKVVKMFVERCKKNGVIPLTTCFSSQHAQHLADVGFKEIKVASYDCASHAMMKILKDKFDHIYVSTGATFNNEIEITSKILPPEKSSFLHCVTRYPTPLNALNLGRMEWLRRFSRPVGFSDHSLKLKDGLNAVKLALTLGAEIIEVHYRIFAAEDSKDGPVSVNKEQFSELKFFSELSETDKMYEIKRLGILEYSKTHNEDFKMSEEEYKNRLYFRGRFASLVYEGGVKRHIYNWERYKE
jgi:sialic acid synthase SpsE